MYGEIRVKQMGEADAVCFGCQFELVAVGVKTPRQVLVHDLDTGFIFPVQKLLPGHILAISIGDVDYIGAIPLHSNDGDSLVAGNAFYRAANRNVL